MTHYVYFKDDGAVRRGEIVGENGDQVIVSYRARRYDVRAAFQLPSYYDKYVELPRSAIYEEVGNVV